MRLATAGPYLLHFRTFVVKKEQDCLVRSRPSCECALMMRPTIEFNCVMNGRLLGTEGTRPEGKPMSVWKVTQGAQAAQAGPGAEAGQGAQGF